MAFDTLYLPNCFDRCDGGLTSAFGTPSPLGTVGVNYPGGSVDMTSQNAAAIFGQMYVIEESSDSPTLDIGEQATITHTFFMDYLNMQNTLIAYPRGTFMKDNSSGPLGPNISRVLSCGAQPVAKTMGLIWRVTMTTECMSFPGPPDEISYENVELNPPAEKHPRYSALTYYQRDQVRNQVVADYVDVKEAYLNNINNLSTDADQWKNQQGQALELLFKKQKGEDSFYLSGYKIQYSKYFWYPQDIDPGGYMQDPFSVIPYQFWTDQNGNNIFLNNAQRNQNLFPNYASLSSPPYGLSWLRQTDVQILNRTWYKLTETWIGAPLGHWDQEWYTPVLMPLQTSASLGGLTLG